MAWLIGFTTYAALLAAVAIIAGGRRRGDLRHADAQHQATAQGHVGIARVGPRRANVGLRPLGAAAHDAAFQRRIG